MAHLAAGLPEPVEQLPGFVATTQTPIVSGTTIGGNALAGGSTGGNTLLHWANRALNGLSTIFGSQTNAVKKVIDQVLVDFGKMINSFNYAVATQFELIILIDQTNGLGAAASIDETVGGKPSRGTIRIQRGLDGAGSGFFIDPTPEESSEFLGRIDNPFAGDAPSTSPAYGKADLYTLIALELTHCLGLFGNSLPGWAARTHGLNIAEQGEGFTPPATSVGSYWAFQGPSVSHLLTSNNGGRTGADMLEAIHSAGHANYSATPITISAESQQWSTVNDIGNAVYEASRRYVPNQAFALMFKDAYDYSTVNPATFGTFHAMQLTTGEVVIRGSNTQSLYYAGASGNDTISLEVSGGKLNIVYNLGNDAPGTSYLAGPGDLPAWSTSFDLSTVTSIRIEAGDGDDTLTINNTGAIPITVDAGTGANTLQITGATGVKFAASQTFANVSIDTASTLVAASAATLLVTDSLSIAGVLDLANGVLIDRTATGSAATIGSLLQAGYANGTWTGSAGSIRSSIAADGTYVSDTLGFAGMASRTALSSLGGFTLQSSDRIVRYTYAGDANLDGTVNFTDLLVLASNYGSVGRDFSQGSFDYDPTGTVNFTDLLLLAQNYGQALAGGLSVISSTPASSAVVAGDPPREADDSVVAEVLL
ncbi:MAG: hypothetical protein QM770_21145 [Tepidisphaeraceae bacterium]